MSFQGYIRSDDSVGTRNYVLVIPQGIIAKSVCDFVAGTKTILTVDHGSGRTANDREPLARSDQCVPDARRRPLEMSRVVGSARA